ncbi:MAG: DUF3263 domain-containing protein [Propionibacteriaceae bacterium]|nr:DUF3263 domain-containing protein [Propionibacteriaceae bacterium]
MSTTEDIMLSRLTDLDRAVLDFERQWWKLPLEKEQAIKQTFDLSGPQYYQILNTLIDRQEALAADPLLVKRLRRMRAQRRDQRHSLRPVKI